MPLVLTAGFAIVALLAAPAKPLEVVYLIRPQAVPEPPLTAMLVPSQTEPGDALPLYLTAKLLLPRATPASNELFEKAYEIVGKPPGEATDEELETVRKVVGPMAEALALTERASRMRRCDWSPLVPPPPSGLAPAIGQLLPTIQGWRELAGAVKFRCYLRVCLGGLW